jgi:TrmH family RNA methyltransferase
MAKGDDVIASIKHPAVAEARKAIAPAAGGPPPCYLVDGRNMVRQALQADAGVQTVFLLDEAHGEETAELRQACSHGRVPCLLVRRGVFFRILGLGYETSVDCLAIVRRPEPPGMPESLPEDFCVLAGETIQDPRNVGVMIRTADGMGPAAVAFSADSADPYSRAAVRSSTGSIFRVPPALPADLPAYVRQLKALGARVIGTSAAAAKACWQTDLTGCVAMLVGNETEGMSAALRETCDELVTIPMAGGAHSFNVTVAAGILLYERSRQMGKG